jgi:Domain of unknown function (DUF4158)
MADEDAVTFFILTGDDLAWLAGFNRDDNRLGVAVQLCTLPWLGWIPDDLTACPSPAVLRLADALAIDHVAAAGPPARLPGRCPRAGPRRRLPALLGTRHPLRGADRAALR